MTHRIALETYLTLGRERGIHWTPLAGTVLRHLWRVGEPLGAYALRDQLSELGQGIHSTSVYRQIDRLAAAGLILPIVLRRAVVISPDPFIAQWLVLVCSNCRRVELVASPSALDLVDSLAAMNSFRRRFVHLECSGLCPYCSDERHPEREDHEESVLSSRRTPVEEDQDAA